MRSRGALTCRTRAQLIAGATLLLAVALPGAVVVAQPAVPAAGSAAPGAEEVPGLPGFSLDPAKWDWPQVAEKAEFQRKIIGAGYSPQELRQIWIVLNFLPGTRRPAVGGVAARPVDGGARPAGPTANGAPGAPRPAGPVGTSAAGGGGGAMIASTGMRMPPFMAMNSVANPASHGRGFRGLEIPYGGNGYTNNGIVQRTNYVDDIIASGNLVFVTWLIEGVHGNPMFGFPASGKPLAVRESALFRFEGGKVAETDFRGDDLALYRGLGGKLSFPAPTPQTSGPARMGVGPTDKGAVILVEARKAAATNPASWEWPSVADAGAIRDQIIAARPNAEERRNLFTVLAMQSGRRWPAPGSSAAKALAAPAAVQAKPGQVRTVARTGNLLGAASLFAPGSISRGRGFRGLEAVFGANGYLPDSLTGRVNRLDSIIAHGDRVWFSWIIEARHTGTLFGFKGDGRPVTVRESAWVRFNKSGQIVESDYYADDLALYLAAGGKVSFPDGGFVAAKAEGSK